MSQPRPSTRTWCDRLQQKLMDAIDAAWAMVEASDDPAVLAKARDRARVCGQLASEARKVLALAPKPDKPGKLPGAIREAFDRLEAATGPDGRASRRDAGGAREAEAAVGVLSAPSVTSPIDAAPPPPFHG